MNKPEFPFLPARRTFLKTGALAGGAIVVAPAGMAQILSSGIAPAAITLDPSRPQITHGVMSGDVVQDRAIVWSKVDRPARMWVEYSTTAKWRNPLRVRGPAALEDSDFTARVDLTGLPAGQQIFYRVLFQDLASPGIYSEAATGTFRTPAHAERNVSFVFSGDEAGQGWGINTAFGGYRTYETMRRLQPDFFIHSGDQIYADGPLSPEVRLDDGTVWKNLIVPAKTKVAETLDEFRGNFAYNLLDENKRRFAAEVPFLVQWDDHETRNNWYPGEVIGDSRFTVTSASLLAARSNRAMFEYNPFRIQNQDPERVYRAIPYGPLLDVFMLDERSYRGPNTANQQNTPSDETAFLGRSQLDWLKRALKQSRSTWKLIASDMPIGLVVPDGNADVPRGTYEAWANGDNGAPSGRELELAELLAFIKHEDIENVVWVTADVHYASANHYHPSRAQFRDFKPFWEFVGGPINAGTFGPNDLDLTFGPEVKFTTIPAGGIKPNRSPAEGMQYFGHGFIDRRSKVLAMSLRDMAGRILYSVDLSPE